MSDDPSLPGGSRTELVFYGALECATPEDRSRYLTEACAGDEKLRLAVIRLLQAHADAGEQFLEHSGLAAILSEADEHFAFLRSEKPGDHIGSYKLVEQIGEGGFGVVWMAEQEKPVRRCVALKILKPGMDTREVIARFQAERQALALMDHPNIARVFDAGGTPAGRPFFVMELVQGTKITEYCDTAKLPPRERLELFIQVCQAVQHAHQKGIIHRDLKPSNILVTKHDGVPVPKVIDFGIAKATDQQLSELSVVTGIEQMIGTPLYMSPEQAEHRTLDIDTRSDIYSLGVLLYELLTGRTPFSAEELVRRGIEEIRKVIREEEPARPSTALISMEREALTTIARSRRTEPPRLISVLKGDLDWIVMRALEKDRSRRYQTASGLAEEIKRHLANEPVLAGPPSQFYRLKKLVRRNRLIFTAGAAVGTAVIAGLGTSTILLFREHEARMYASRMLAELQATAPAFVEQARALVDRGEFESAIEKLEYAAKLRPSEAEYLAAKGDFLESLLRLSEAADAYRAALNLEPRHKRAAKNLALCERLLASKANQWRLSREELSELYAIMQQEQRATAQLMPVARLLGEEKQLLLDFWLTQLQDLRLSPERPLKQRLSMRSDGLLALDLSGTQITDLRHLKEMPLGELNCTNCTGITDIACLRELPLKELSLAGTGIYDIAPVSEMRSLKVLRLNDSKVLNLAPLRGLPLQVLTLGGLDVYDLSPLRGMPLEELSIRNSRVTDLSPLSDIPLRRLNLDGIPASSLAPLARVPLDRLEMRNMTPESLDFLRASPIRELYLSQCPLRNISPLFEATNLEILALPEDYRSWEETERAKLHALRNHPKLRKIGVEAESGGSAEHLPSAENFWHQWDYETATLKPLREAGIRVGMKILPDQTWEVDLKNEPVKDVACLSSAPISRLGLQNTKVTDLKPISKLQLRALSIQGTRIKDISPLAGMPLEELDLGRTLVTDLTPLRGMPLKRLGIEQSGISDISALKGMALQEFWMGTTLVSDLSPLKGMPIRVLHIDDCLRLKDVSPIVDMHTLEQVLAPKTAHNLNVLRGLARLRYISYEMDAAVNRPAHTSEEFWAMDTPATLEDLARQERYTELERVMRIRIANHNTSEPWKEYARLAAAVLAQGHYDDYREVCAEMLLRHGDSHPEPTAKVCGLAPSAIPNGDLERLLRASIAQHDNFRNYPWTVLSCALAYYRLGQWKEVANLLENYPNVHGAPYSTSRSVLAMAYHRQGNVSAAIDTLADARQRTQNEITKPFGDPAHWHDMLAALLLWKEADALIGKSPQAPAPK